jgi:hypothetical protein
MIDDTTSTSTRNISNSEYDSYLAFKESKIRDAALAEGQQMASAQHLAEDREADAIALKKLTDKGLSLRDAFGASSTDRGRGAIINIHRSSFGSKTTAYNRLRRMAAAQGLVK